MDHANGPSTDDVYHTHRNVVMNNWLVNTTGKDDGFLELDLLQEHLNLLVKVSPEMLHRIFQAHHLLCVGCILRSW